jgi:hypothetical protein
MSEAGFFRTREEAKKASATRRRTTPTAPK